MPAHGRAPGSGRRRAPLGRVRTNTLRGPVPACSDECPLRAPGRGRSDGCPARRRRGPVRTNARPDRQGGAGGAGGEARTNVRVPRVGKGRRVHGRGALCCVPAVTIGTDRRAFRTNTLARIGRCRRARIRTNPSPGHSTRPASRSPRSPGGRGSWRRVAADTPPDAEPARSGASSESWAPFRAFGFPS